MHVLSDANGLPLRVGLSSANTRDSLALPGACAPAPTRVAARSARGHHLRRLLTVLDPVARYFPNFVPDVCAQPLQHAPRHTHGAGDGEITVDTADRG